MFYVYFVHFDYFAERAFETQEEAEGYARSTTFACHIYKGPYGTRELVSTIKSMY